MARTFEKHGNHGILDFVNTLGNRFYKEKIDRLQSLDDLLAFCREFGILTDEETRGLATDNAVTQQEMLNTALHLRELLFDVFVQIADQAESVRPDAPNFDAARELGKALHAAEQARILEIGDEGLTWRWQDPQDPTRPTAELSLIAKDFIANCDHKRLRKCAMHDCGVLFLDHSRSGRRQWCSMAECGNRSKVSRYRTRHAKDTA